MGYLDLWTQGIQSIYLPPGLYFVDITGWSAHYIWTSRKCFPFTLASSQVITQRRIQWQSFYDWIRLWNSATNLFVLIWIYTSKFKEILMLCGNFLLTTKDMLSTAHHLQNSEMHKLKIVLSYTFLHLPSFSELFAYLTLNVKVSKLMQITN